MIFRPQRTAELKGGPQSIFGYSSVVLNLLSGSLWAD